MASARRDIGLGQPNNFDDYMGCDLSDKGFDGPDNGMMATVEEGPDDDDGGSPFDADSQLQEREGHETNRDEIETALVNAQKSYAAVFNKHVQSLHQNATELVETEYFELHKRVSEWRTKVSKWLKQISEQKQFDMPTYKSSVMTKVGKQGQVKKFSDVAEGCGRDDVCRLFLTTLMLTNQYAVDIDNHGEKGQPTVGDFDVKLLVEPQKGISEGETTALEVPFEERGASKIEKRPRNSQTESETAPEKKSRRAKYSQSRGHDAEADASSPQQAQKKSRIESH
eukprot:Selendium_serpulae@DN6239_c1_g1_i1.p3